MNFYSKLELKTALDELGDRFKDCIPNSSLVIAAARCNDIISVEEWISFFDGFLQITLDEGKH